MTSGGALIAGGPGEPPSHGGRCIAADCAADAAG